MIRILLKWGKTALVSGAPLLTNQANEPFGRDISSAPTQHHILIMQLWCKYVHTRLAKSCRQLLAIFDCRCVDAREGGEEEMISPQGSPVQAPALGEPLDVSCPQNVPFTGFSVKVSATLL